jgi:hypothetical protein
MCAIEYFFCFCFVQLNNSEPVGRAQSSTVISIASVVDFPADTDLESIDDKGKLNSDLEKKCE